MNTEIAQIGQLSLHTLVPLAALASLGLAAVHVDKVDVMSVGRADAADDAKVIRRLDVHDVGIFARAHRLTLGALRVVRISVALGLHGNLESLRTVQEIPRIGHVYLFRFSYCLDNLISHVF